MIGMIKPLVKGARKSRDWIGPSLAYAVGAISSSVVLGLILGWVGPFLVPRAWASSVLILCAVVGIVLGVRDLQGRTLTLCRQTNPLWWRQLGRARAALLWGVDIGLGFSTIRVASLYWIVALLVLAFATSRQGALILGTYGFALVMNFTLGVGILERILPGVPAHARVLQFFRPARFGLGVLLITWSVFVIIVLATAPEWYRA